MHVLVTYASKHGATRGIAERIGAVLVESGLSADVLPVEDVSDLSPYDAFVVGSAVYVGRWRKPARRFLADYQDVLARHPLWLFSSGPTGEGRPDALLEGWTFPEDLKSLAVGLEPRDVVLFHGALDEKSLGFVERWVVRGIGAPVGDFRNWGAISAWARAIATGLSEQATEPALA